jgi:hypothetical protein
MNLSGYSEYRCNAHGWKSFYKREGTKIATYETMNCRRLLHETEADALLFLQNEGYRHDIDHSDEFSSDLEEFREI